MAVSRLLFYEHVTRIYYVLNAMLAGNAVCRDKVVDQIFMTPHKEKT